MNQKAKYNNSSNSLVLGRWSQAKIYLVPKEAESLAELEVVEVVLLDEGDPDDVEAGEQPASPRGLLVGDGLCLVHLKGDQPMMVWGSKLVRPKLT